MEFFRKVKRKIEEGFLEELTAELKWLRTYIRRYRAVIAIHLLLGLAAIVMGLVTSVASKYLIDAVTGYETGSIAGAAAMMAGMLLGNLLLKSGADRIGAAVNIRVQQEIQAEVYRHVLETDWESLEQYRSGDLMHRLLGDVGTVAGGVTGFVPSVAGAAVQFLGALAIMLWYDPTMAAIALLGIPVAILCSRLLVSRMREHNIRMKALSSDMTSFYEDTFENLTSIKAFDITGGFCGKMSGLQRQYRDEYLTYNRFSVKTSAFLSLLGMAVSGGCFGWGVYRLWSGAITFGSMTLFLQLSGTLSGAFSTLIGMASGVISISTSAGRVMEVTELPSEAVEAGRDYRQERDIRLRLEKACFSYRDGRPILKEVDLEARPGELIALTGPSGEGKTTLLRLLLGLIRPCSGRAELLCGLEKAPLSSATRSAFAYVPQGNSVMAGTVAENLRMVAPDATDEELEQVLELACAREFVDRLPGGLNHPIGGRGKGLSEGQAQRLAIARALLKGAPVLLLDEATSALDEATEETLLRKLMASDRVRTCIFVTHRPGAMQFCTRQYHVEDGCVILKRKEAD